MKRRKTEGNLHLLSTNNGLIAKYYFQFFRRETEAQKEWINNEARIQNEVGLLLGWEIKQPQKDKKNKDIPKRKGVGAERERLRASEYCQNIEKSVKQEANIMISGSMGEHWL